MDAATAKKLNELLTDFKSTGSKDIGVYLASRMVEVGFRFSSQEETEAKKPPPPVKFLLGGCKFAGCCVRCNDAYSAGEKVFWTDGVGSWCVGCSTTEEQTEAGTYWTNYQKQLEKTK